MQYKHFSIEEREVLQHMRWERRSVRSIAAALKRSPSSVSRELRRNFPPEREQYTPRIAHARALKKRMCRGRTERLKNESLRAYVSSKLKTGWSPEQIAGKSRADTGLSISHEAIYQYIYAQVHRNGWGSLRPGREDLRLYLKRRHKRRAQKGMRSVRRVLRPRIASIEERPKVVERRMRIGDWEGDSMVSRKSTVALNTLVERKTGLVFITKVENGTSGATFRAVTERLSSLPAPLRRTLTLDNGSENACAPELEGVLGIDCYGAHPYSSWERGTNENTNGLIRWYLPKGTDFALVSDATIREIEYALNTRPRKRLGWRTPLEAMSVALQS